jgi:AAA domain
MTAEQPPWLPRQPRPYTPELRDELLQFAAMRLVRFGEEGAEESVSTHLVFGASWAEPAARRLAADVMAEARSWQNGQLLDRYRAYREAELASPDRLAGLEKAAREERRQKRLAALEDDQWARREMAAQGWQPPDATARLDAELKLPRFGEPQRVNGLAGIAHNVLVAGPRKTGKTQLLVNLSGSLSMSGWLQREAPPAPQQWVPGYFLGLSACWLNGNVAYVNLEMDADDWRDVFRALPPGSFNGERIFPLHRRGLPLPVITSAAAREWFVAWLRERQIEVLIIDTWAQFCARSGVLRLNDDGEVLPVLTGLDGIKEAAGVSSVYISIHMPHQTGERHLERFKGAGAVGDWADVLWTFTADAEGTRYIGAVGRARIDAADQAVDFAEGGLLLWGTSGTKAQTQASRTAAKITGALEKVRPAGMLTEDLLSAVGGHRETVRGKLAQMLADGDVVMVPRGRAKRYFLPGDLPD